MVEELRQAGKKLPQEVMPVDLAQLIPPLVRAEVDFILPTLIRIKKAAERRKDKEAIAELRVLLEELEKEQT
jgi:hypothetical protein